MKHREKDFLYKEYIENNRSADDIARELKIDQKTVWTWLKKHNIQTRARGTDYGQNFKKGQVSSFKGKTHTLENKQKIREQRLKDGRVPYLKDGIHWLHHKGAISPNYKGGVTPERQSLYSSLKWTNSVKEVWKRDNATCQNCGFKNIGKERIEFHIHHLLPFAEYRHLRCDTDNLVLICKKCHLWVHSNGNNENKFLPKKGELPKWIS